MIKRILTLTMLATSLFLTAFAVNHNVLKITSGKSPVLPPDNLPVDYITEAEGKNLTFAAKITFDPDGFGDFDLYGVDFKAIFSEDETKVYFPQIIPLEGTQKEGTYVVGNLNKDSNGRRSITVKANQLLQNYETLDDYLIAKTGMTAADYAAYCNTTVEDITELIGWEGPRYFYFVPAIDDSNVWGAMKLLDELVMEESEEGVFRPAGDDTVYLLSWLYDGNSGYDYSIAGLELTPVVEQLISVPSEGVEYKMFQHTVIDSYDTQKVELCQIGFKGDKVYIPGLLFGESSAYRRDYVEGTIDAEGVITLTSPLYYNEENKEYKIIRAYDENAYVNFDDLCIEAETEYNPIQLKYDTESGVITLLQNAQLAEFAYGSKYPDNLMKHSYIDIKNIPFNTPANPTKFKAQNFEEVSFKIPFEDIYGNKIDPTYLYYELFVNTDDNPYIFTKEDFMVKADISELPVSFSDFSVQNDKKGGIRIYWIGPEWEDLGVRSIYILNGEKKYSDIVWLSGRQNYELIYDFVPQSVSPESDSQVESLSSIIFSFDELVGVNPSLLDDVTFKSDAKDVNSSFSIGIDGMSLVFTLQETEIADGDYVMTLPKGLMGTKAWADSQHLNGRTNDLLTYKWTVKKLSGGIDAVTIDSEVKYFNLQGIQILNPASSDVLIRLSGNKAEIIVY